MAKRLQRDAGEILPSGWREDIPLPTLKEAEEAVQKIEEDIDKRLENLKGKVEGTSPEMFNTQITI